MLTPNASEPVDSRFSLLALWGAVRKNWILALAIAAVVAGGITFYTVGQTKIYQSTATILFDPSVPRPLGDQVRTVDTEVSSYWNNKEYYRTQQWMLQSMRVATQVVRDLELHKDPTFIAGQPAERKLPPREIAVEQAARMLTANLSVEQVKDSRLMTVKYEDAAPKRAQKVLAAIVDTYTEDNLEDVFEAATMAGDWLRSQVGTLRSDLEKSELSLHQYKKERNILSLSLDDQSNMLRGEMQQLGQALTQVRAKRERVLARLRELRAINVDDPSSLPAAELVESPLLQQLRATYVTLKAEVGSMIGLGRGENHPLAKEVQNRLDTTKAALLAEVANIKAVQEHDLAALDHEIAGLQGLYNRAEKRALELNLMEIEYNRLLRGKENNEKLFSLVIERSKETDLTRMLRVNNVRVVDRPGLPKSPVRPNVPLHVAGGLLFGIVLGLVAAIGKEQLDRTLKTPDDVERELGLAFLGLLPSIGDSAGYGTYAPYSMKQRRSKKRRAPATAAEIPPELFAHHHPASGIAEAVRSIRTNIMFMSPDHPYRTLLVTSAGPSEGKTTVACAIAIAMAQAGQRVVLVDCDLRRPRVHRVFKRMNDVGLTTALLDGELDASAIGTTEVPNLSIVPTGPLPPNPAEVLHSDAFRRLVQALSERYDRVVIDSPPVIPVTDAAVVGTIVDGTVLVVRASRTSKDLARRAVRSLRGVSGRVIGVVLNAVNLDGSHYGMQQYYYYKREGYGSDRPGPSADDAPPDHAGTA